MTHRYLVSTMVALLVVAKLPCAPKACTNIILDLNGTVVQVEKGWLTWGWDIGLLSVISYKILGGAFDRLGTMPFEVLRQTPVPIAYYAHWCAGRGLPCLPNGQVMPDIMCAWQAGLITSEECAELACDTAKNLWLSKTLFKNKREYLLTTAIIKKAIFNPNMLAQRTKIMPGAVELLMECRKKGCTHYVLSNWDAQSGTQLLFAPHLQPLWDQIPRSNVLLSGLVGIVKPQHNFFEYICAKYKLDPAECVFIDDQIENIKAAQACGFQAIHIQNGDYNAVRAELIALGAL